jgi:hypothetical protein
MMARDERTRPFAKPSRLFFGIHHPFQSDIKVKDIGRVIPDHIPLLLKYWVEENAEFVEAQLKAKLVNERELSIERARENMDALAQNFATQTQIRVGESSKVPGQLDQSKFTM